MPQMLLENDSTHFSSPALSLQSLNPRGKESPKATLPCQTQHAFHPTSSSKKKQKESQVSEPEKHRPRQLERKRTHFFHCDEELGSLRVRPRVRLRTTIKRQRKKKVSQLSTTPSPPKKNWDMNRTIESSPGSVCLIWKFSSSNLVP